MIVEKIGDDDPLFSDMIDWVIAQADSPKNAFLKARHMAPFMENKKRYLICRYLDEIQLDLNDVRQALKSLVYPATPKNCCNAYVLGDGNYFFFSVLNPPIENLLRDVVFEHEQGGLTSETYERIKEYLQFINEVRGLK